MTVWVEGYIYIHNSSGNGSTVDKRETDKVIKVGKKIDLERKGDR